MSRILRNVHAAAKRLHTAGHMDEVTMWEFDALCLPPKRTFSAEDVQRIRTASHVSQSVFAAFLGVGKTTVQQWEQGVKKPSGPAAKLLDIVDRKGLATLATE
ncbi:MAG: DNA-binding transcriptional regulator [Rhodospirillaceae bacterium]|nr:DNA-binding transcriptional regulator [Rhodospirillales bacterium]